MALLPAGKDAFTIEMVDTPPTHLLFKVDSFSRLSRHQQSMTFVAGNYKWRLKISLGNNSSDGDRIYLCLSLADFDALPKKWKVNAGCSIFLRNNKSLNYLCFRGKEQQFDRKNTEWGFSISKKMLTDPANGYLLDDGCHFGAEIVSSQTLSIQCLSCLEWEIPYSSISEGVWTSKKFFLGGFEWSSKVSGGERVVVFIHLEPELFGEYRKVEAEICIRLRNKASNCFARASHCFTTDQAVCEISSTEWFKPGKDNCFLEAEITVKNVEYWSLFSEGSDSEL